MSVNFASDVAAKLEYANLLRRIIIARSDTTHPDPLPLSWSAFEVAIRNQCGIPDSKRIIVTYNDQDGDPVQVDTDEELAELAHNLHTGELKSLKFFVSVQDYEHVEDENDFVMIPSPPSSDFDRLSQDGDIEETDSVSNHTVPSNDVNSIMEHGEYYSSAENKNIDDSPDQAEKESTHSSSEEKGKGKAEDVEATTSVPEVTLAESAPSGEVTKDPKEYTSFVPVISASESSNNESTSSNEPNVEPSESSSKGEFEDYLNEMQPLIDQLLTKLESRPEFIPRLLESFNSSLNSRNWGITVEAPVQPVPVPSKPTVQWSGVSCDGCKVPAFTGSRYKCLTCNDYDLCTSCYDKVGTEGQSFEHPSEHQFERLESPAKVWRGVTCDGCGRVAFTGPRFKCRDCDDFDYCGKCRSEKPHFPRHTFDCLDPELRSQDAKVWTGVICDGCKQKAFAGLRYKCKDCDDFDFCGKCYLEKPHFEGHNFDCLDPESRSRYALHSRRSYHRGQGHSSLGYRHSCHGRQGRERFMGCPDRQGHRQSWHSYHSFTTPTLISSDRFPCHIGDSLAQASSTPIPIPIVRPANSTEFNMNVSVERATGTSPPTMPGSFPMSKSKNESISYADVARRGVSETQQHARPRYGIDIETGHNSYVNVGELSDADMNEKQGDLLVMGFDNVEINNDLLRTYNGEMEHVVDKLIAMKGSGL